MKILIASDIHGRITRMRRLAEVLDSYEPDKIILCGDYAYNGPRNGVPDDYDPMGVIQILNRYADRIIGVKGNCDSRVDEMLLHFSLKDYQRISLNGIFMELYHGDDFSLPMVEHIPGDLLISGHTHVPVLCEENGCVLINPGSVSFPKGGSEPSYVIMEDRHIERRRLTDEAVLDQLDF